MDSHCGKNEEGSIWWDFARNRALGSLGCSSELKELTGQAGVDDEFGGNTIRHSMMTKLRQEGASLEQVNEFTRHAPGSNVVDRFYNKPEKAQDLSSVVYVGQVIWIIQGGGGCNVDICCAGVDGNLFESNPLVGFETEPEPINHSTVFLMKLRSITSGHMGLSLDGKAHDGMKSQLVVVCYLDHITHAVVDWFWFAVKAKWYDNAKIPSCNPAYTNKDSIQYKEKIEFGGRTEYRRFRGRDRYVVITNPIEANEDRINYMDDARASAIARIDNLNASRNDYNASTLNIIQTFILAALPYLITSITDINDPLLALNGAADEASPK
ncbi:MAG: hypothetical protein EZS28_013295 [Streblomastix strix]|uniref:Tyr recombinase domain-containing protein n=1 Tax=Streblomastix strix TaxID=222440 RepID=A0A5J4W9X8_9EUKA|nr:MAG: hypothetical protein EZS28_013295 [Streblomastix strix]